VRDLTPKEGKEREKIQKELRKAGDELLQAIEEIVSSCVLLCDVERLHNLAHIIDVQEGYEVIHRLREAGLSAELTKLCDKAGRIPDKNRRLNK